MEKDEFLKIIVDEIHTTVLATVDSIGRPITSVIDMMMHKDDKLYFLTAKGKNLYDRLKNNQHVSLSGVKGNDTMSSVAATFIGNAREIGSAKLLELFDRNTYMYDIYPTAQSRKVLTVFEIYEGTGEFFDLTQKPVFRQSFTFNNAEVKKAGYFITNNCIECGVCADVCPTDCIDAGIPYNINQHNCLHCGNCYSECPADAIIKSR